MVIPAYNAEDCIARAISSVLAQTLPPHEIVIVDDGSTDGTADIAKRFAGVRVLSQLRAGASQARNAGIRACNGEIVAFLDADDEWLESKLEKQLDLHQGQDIALSFCRSNEFDEQGNELGDTFRDLAPRRGNVWRDLLATNFIATPTVMASRENLVALGGFDTRLKVGEDQDMWIRLARLGPVDFVDDSLVRVHLRPGGLSGSGFHDQVNYTLPMIWRHIQTLRSDLSDDEIRAIRSARTGRTGRNAYAHGEFGLALPLILEAIFQGDSLFHNLYHLAAAAPAFRHLRTLLQTRFRGNPCKGRAGASATEKSLDA